MATTMKSRIRNAVVAGIALAVVSVPVSAARAQDTIVTRDTVELTRAEIQARRQAVVQELMTLTPKESDGFWPVYREYRNAVEAVNDEKVMLTAKYLDSYDSLSTEQAEKLLKDWFKVREKHLKVQQDYVGRFRKVIPMQKVARFYQIENALDAIISANIQANLPMAR